MSATEMYRTALVRQMVMHFAELAGFDGHVLVTFDRRRFDRACRRYRLKPADDGDYGEAIVDPARPAVPIVWINRSENVSFARLARTCAHESLHVALPAMRHGRAYEKAVTRLTRGQEP